MASSYAHPSTSFDSTMQASGILNAKNLKPLDEVLRCHICFDYFTNCMMTKCNHNYCSVCIRRYMNYKSQCPTCFQVATEPELQNNRLIDEIIRIYKKIREKLQIPIDSLNKPYPEQSSSSTSAASDNSKKSIKAESSKETISKQLTSEVCASDEVSCPVCYTTVPNSKINIHLDTCLKQTEDRNQRKSLPKLVYHLLSDKEIRKKLKEHGLSTVGPRQALIRRHKNFIILYNANCDSLNPKPVSDLLLEIEKQELEERLNATERSVQVNKKSDPSLIEKEHELYVQEHQSQFSVLIQDVQQRALGNVFIKKDVDVSEGTCNITDESGNIIGESTLKVGYPSDEEPVIVKEELSESLLQDLYQGDNTENVTTKHNMSAHKELDSDYKSTSHISFRIKKELPTVKMKDDSKFLLDSSNQDLSVDSPSPLDDFDVSKTPISKFPKKKYARRLSTEERNAQRKK